MLACELSLAGVRPVVLERLAQPPDEIRANGLVGQVVRMLDRRGLYQRLTGDSEIPQPAPMFPFGALPLDLATLDDNPFYLLPVPQPRIQQVLDERAAELGVEVRRGHELTGLSQRADEVIIDVDCPEGRYEMRCRYVVGADGGHSTTRQLAGIGFPGATNDDVVARTVEVAVPADLVDTATGGLNVPGYGHIPPMIYQRTDTGVFAFGNLPSRLPLMFTVEWTADGIDETVPFTLGEFRESVRRVLGADLPLQPPAHRLTRTTGVNTRLADRFSDDRVLLVGDAAHVQFVLGGPGLNLGLQDAINVGWKLAASIRGWAPRRLLDTYTAERWPAARRAAMHTQAQLALLAPGAEVTALRELFAELLGDVHTVAHIANLMAGADVHYDMGVADAHPLVGRWAPDLVLDTGHGTLRLAELTRTARPLLLDLTEDACFASEVDGWRDRVDTVTGSTRDSHACALLLRPDCYVAWATDTARPDQALRESLRAALVTWFGAPRPYRRNGHPRNVGWIRSPTHRTVWRARQTPTKESSRDCLQLSNLVRTLNLAGTRPLPALRLRALPSAAGLRRVEGGPVGGSPRQPHSLHRPLLADLETCDGQGQPMPYASWGKWVLARTMGADQPRLLGLAGRVAVDGRSPRDLPPEQLAAANRIIDAAAIDAGRSPDAVRRIYNIGGEFSRNGKGFLQGPPAVWVEQLTELTLVHGVSGYILCRVESGDIVRRFADEVVPAIRNAVRTERGRQGMSAHADRGVDRLRPRQPSRNRGIR